MNDATDVTGRIHGPGLTDVRGMIMAHDGFRRGLLPVADLVRGVTAGDRRRAAVVADHLELMLDMLQHHHEGEDEMLWPLLLERVPDELAPIVLLMESQHEGVHGALDEVRPLLRAWREEPDAAVTSRLADAVEHLVLLLVEHLQAEEQRLLPIAARTVTPAEWDAMSQRGIRGIPLRKGPVIFGILMEVGDPEVVAGDLAKAPAPVRLIMRLTAPRAWRRYERRLLGI